MYEESFDAKGINTAFSIWYHCAHLLLPLLSCSYGCWGAILPAGNQRVNNKMPLKTIT
jgi:hypothetical protein